MPVWFQNDWLGLIALAAAVVIWGIRLEGRVNLADQRQEAMMGLLREHYATRTEVAAVKGAIDTLSPQVIDTKNAVLRIENKVDAFLVSALQHLPVK